VAAPKVERGPSQPGIGPPPPHRSRQTCKLNHIDPLEYLADVLTRIVNVHPNSDMLGAKAFSRHDTKVLSDYPHCDPDYPRGTLFINLHQAFTPTSLAQPQTDQIER
jgi:hypothetical protein